MLFSLEVALKSPSFVIIDPFMSVSLSLSFIDHLIKFSYHFNFLGARTSSDITRVSLFAESLGEGDGS